MAIDTVDMTAVLRDLTAEGWTITAAHLAVLGVGADLAGAIPHPGVIAI
jgi:hypothetical protein